MKYGSGDDLNALVFADDAVLWGGSTTKIKFMEPEIYTVGPENQPHKNSHDASQSVRHAGQHCAGW